MSWPTSCLSDASLATSFMSLHAATTAASRNRVVSLNWQRKFHPWCGVIVAGTIHNIISGYTRLHLPRNIYSLDRRANNRLVNEPLLVGFHQTTTQVQMIKGNSLHSWQDVARDLKCEICGFVPTPRKYEETARDVANGVASVESSLANCWAGWTGLTLVEPLTTFKQKYDFYFLWFLL